ncbi:MAG TPA: hypothetical protein VKD00_06065 [Methyloceanibacter sp.]|nr:hypothetical protein [Methyloceanibacter sp.]
MSKDHIPADWDAMPLDALCAHFNRALRRDGAPQSILDALNYELRSHGLAAFEHPNCRDRLAEVSVKQLRELMAALIQVRAACAAVTDELLIALDRIRRR